MKLCVMGLGYIGLPTAVMFAHHGVTVHGVDVNPKVVEMLNARKLHIEEPGLKEIMTETLDNGRLTISTRPEEADAYIIAVPTPINEDKTANLDYVRSATEMIVPYLRNQNLVILESTVPPKTVENVMIPILKTSGLKIGEELYVSHSPERVLPGRLFEELVNNERIVGGINEKSSELTAQLYRSFVKGKIHQTSVTTAEMVKLMENTYRDVNIALANEFAKIAEKIGFNIWEAIELANCHPRVNIHRPGPGVGGHCIAVDPWFIIEQAPENAKLIKLSRETNDTMPNYVANKVEQLVGNITDPVVTVLGLAFKGNIDDMRESPSLKVIELLKKFARVKVYDPHVQKNDFENKYDQFEDSVVDSDVILILTDHNEFKHLDATVASKVMRTRIILDTRNVIDPSVWMNHGFSTMLLGVCEEHHVYTAYNEAAATK